VSHAVIDFATEAASRISRSPSAAGERDSKDHATSEAEKSGVEIMPDHKGDASNGRDEGQ
jgi:hypothetical protein